MTSISHRFINALLKQPVDCTPIWIMRQAGRYLPEYREVRQKAGDFLTLCKTPELACEVTMQPLRRFDLDAAILFSDILTIPDAMELGLYFSQGEGPCFQHPIREASQIAKLKMPQPENELKYVMDAVRLIKKELAGRLPLIGFAGSPWTVATYMVEGQGSKTFSRIRGLLYSDPKILHQLLDKLAQVTADYLNGQIAAGVDAVMLFDTWGGLLSPDNYLEFSLRYMQQILAKLHREYDGKKIPVILFTKNAGQWLEKIAATGCDAVGVDWMTDIGQAKARVGEKVALQGNMDPAVLYASPETIRAEAKKIIDAVGKGTGHVFNLGHGIEKDVPPEHVKVLVDAVHEFSRV